MKVADDLELSDEEVMADLWQRAAKTEILLSVILQAQAEILSKVSNIPLDEAMEKINEMIRSEFGVEEDS